MFLEDELLAYVKAGDYPFHMPGHKRSTGINPFLSGSFPLTSVDITEIPGFDDLHEPAGILEEEMERAAAFYGTEATLFSVNGSTASNLAAISAAAPFGGSILVSENCHRSVFHAAELLHLETELIRLRQIAPDVPGPVDPETVGRLLDGSSASAVVITSPTYEGVVSDVAAIAEVAHRHGAALIVDEAHGAHFSLHPAFPTSAVRLGADLVTQSLHKTLPSLTQTSVLHNVSGRVPTEALHKWFDIYESSSPSYILMASITSCLHTLMEGGSRLFDGYAKRLACLRGELGELRHLTLLAGRAASEFGGDVCGTDAAGGLTGNFYDPSKLVILTEGDGVPARFKGGAALDGPALAEILRREYGLIFEKTAPHYALAMTSVCDDGEGFDRLVRALFEIDERLDGQGD